jgi:hypothetical protein
MEATNKKRRWFRYSLRSLLVVWTIAAMAIGWNVHRQRIIKAERAKLVGSWEVNGRSDTGSYSMTLFELSDLDFDVGVPHDDVGTIDFGSSKGIYRVVGDTLEMAVNHPGEPRPTTFTDAKLFWDAKRIPSAGDRSQTEMN